jgi:CRISPR-associated exonuclease Cas4
MDYPEHDLLPISALQHLLFCERQCALIHIERIWSENLFTAEGHIMHQKVHDVDKASRRVIHVEYGLPIRSLRLGLIGKADVVEFHKQKGRDGTLWRPFPVEYKRGKPKKDNWDKVQLCAQALCLEEMLGCDVPDGALFYGKTRHREEVVFDLEIKRITEKASERLHLLLNSGRTPPGQFAKKCKQCSLVDDCQPKIISKRKSVENYLKKELSET